MKETTKKLGNPVVAAVTAEKVIDKASETIPFLIKLFVTIGVVAYAINRYTNRFVKEQEISAYPQSNITFAQAKAKADSIYKSTGLISDDFANVYKQLTGLNYNGYIRVFNEFGHKSNAYGLGEMNLTEWIRNVFDNDQVQKLSFLLGGVFF